MNQDTYERLCELAARDQWRLDDLAWSQLDFSAVPLEYRQAAADALAQLHWGERTAHLAAQRLATMLDDGAARRFCLTQVDDEARHVAFFERLMRALGCEGQVRPSVYSLMAEVEKADTPELLLAGMQILIESTAHSLFVELTRVLQWMGEQLDVLPDVRNAMNLVIGEWMPKLLARDESRHIAFGLKWLGEKVPQLDSAARAKLEASALDWGSRVRNQAAAPDLLDGLGVAGRVIGDRLIDDLNLRFSQLGLQARLAPLP